MALNYFILITKLLKLAFVLRLIVVGQFLFITLKFDNIIDLD